MGWWYAAKFAPCAKLPLGVALYNPQHGQIQFINPFAQQLLAKLDPTILQQSDQYRVDLAINNSKIGSYPFEVVGANGATSSNAQPTSAASGNDTSAGMPTSASLPAAPDATTPPFTGNIGDQSFVVASNGSSAQAQRTRKTCLRRCACPSIG